MAYNANFKYILVHKNVQVNFLQWLLQILTDFGIFCAKLTSNELCTSGTDRLNFLTLFAAVIYR